MKSCFQQLSAAALFLVCSVLGAQDPGVSPEALKAGDHIEVRGHGGQTYALTVVSVKDGVLQARCLRSGSEFRGELSAISSIERLQVQPEQDMAPVMTLIGSGLEGAAAQ